MQNKMECCIPQNPEENLKPLIHRVSFFLFTGRRENKNHHTINLVVWDDIMGVDAFGETCMQFHGEHTIDIGLCDGMRASSAYSHRWIVHFFKNFLIWSIVISILLPMSTRKVVIDMLLALWSMSTSLQLEEHSRICYGWMWGTLSCAECCSHCISYDMHFSCQCLIGNISISWQIFQQIALQQCSRCSDSSLVHTLANR